jgi:ABC-type amino acid transport substrate-binding protein
MSKHVITRRRVLAACTLLAPAAWAQTPNPAAADAEPTALEKIRKRGTLVVGLYNEMQPFHDAGKGIDVELARALAKSMGLGLSMLPFNAAEDMNDDLRNMVWRGHYLGFGPADVLMHVPVDRPLMQANPRVNIFAPYYRERIVIARRVSEVPQMNSLDAFAGKRIAVPGQTLAGWLMIGAENGRYRDQLLTKWKDGIEAARALQRGEVAAAAATASELEFALAGDPAYVIEPLPLPKAKDGWVVGLAVKKDAVDLAQALQAAMNGLAASGELGRVFATAKVAWARP